MLINSTLGFFGGKIPAQKSILMMPYWPALDWFPMLTSMLDGQPILFDSDELLLSFDRLSHPLWMWFSLVAGFVSNTHINKGRCLRRLKTLCYLSYQSRFSNSMIIISESSGFLVSAIFVGVIEA